MVINKGKEAIEGKIMIKVFKDHCAIVTLVIKNMRYKYKIGSHTSFRKFNICGQLLT